MLAGRWYLHVSTTEPRKLCSLLRQRGLFRQRGLVTFASASPSLASCAVWLVMQRGLVRQRGLVTWASAPRSLASCAACAAAAFSAAAFCAAALASASALLFTQSAYVSIRQHTSAYALASASALLFTQCLFKDICMRVLKEAVGEEARCLLWLLPLPI